MSTLLKKWVLGLSLFLSLTVYGEDNISARREGEPGSTVLNQEKLGFQPAVGVLFYTDEQGSSTTRAAAGIFAEWNLLTTFGQATNDWFMGPASGVIYSHTGGAGANFLGTTASAGVPDTGQMLLLPLDLKVGYALSGMTRISAHAGGNVLYRTRAPAIQAGETNRDNANWTVYPNIGADFEAAIGRNMSLLIRPDATITLGEDIYNGMIGLSIALR